MIKVNKRPEDSEIWGCLSRELGRDVVVIALAPIALVVFTGLALHAATISLFETVRAPGGEDVARAAPPADYPPSNYLPLVINNLQAPRPTSTATSTSTPTATSTSTATPTATATSTATSTPTATATSTPTATATSTSTPEPCSCEAYPIAIHQSLLAGKKGQVINDILHGTEEGNFGWLRWPYDPSGGSAETLADALSRPDTCEFENAMDPGDTHLSVGDWIWANTPVSNDSKIRVALDSLISAGWIRVVVFDQHSYDNGGANGMYHAANFAIVELIEYNLPETNTISVLFVDYDNTGCID